ncbi:hypothetical protein V8D89_009897 [Ganoderma adspersum]
MSNTPHQRPLSSKSAQRGTPPSSRPVSASKSKATSYYEKLPLKSWVDVKRAIGAGSLQAGDVLYMKGLRFELRDTNIKRESSAAHRSKQRNAGLDSSRTSQNKSNVKAEEGVPQYEYGNLKARPYDSMGGSRSAETGGGQASPPQVASSRMPAPDINTPTQSKTLDRPLSYARAAAAGASIATRQPSQASVNRSAAVSRPASRGREASHVATGPTARKGPASSKGSILDSRPASARERIERSTGRTHGGRDQIPSSSTGNDGEIEREVDTSKYGLKDEDSTALSSPSLSVKAQESASGEILHHGIILTIEEDYMLLAATTTFGSSKRLIRETGEKVIRDESFGVYLGVNDAPREEGMLYDSITMMSGPKTLTKWIYLRTATKIKFDDVVQEDPTIAWIRGPTEEKYDLQTVEHIISCIQKNGPLDPDERKACQEAASGDGGVVSAPASGQQPVA